MNDQNTEETESTKTKQTSFVGTQTRSPRKNILIFGAAILVLLAAGAVILGAQSTEQPQTKTQVEQPKSSVSTEFPKPRPVEYSETNTPSSYATFLAFALEAYWAGGNVNGAVAPAHKYYPSTADLQDPEWVKTNIKIPAQVSKLMSEGVIVYTPVGCDASSKSSEQNKCTSFTIKADGKEVAKSKN